MPRLIPIRTENDPEQYEEIQERVEAPPDIICHESDVFVEETDGATVNGMPVVVLQVVDDSDSFRPATGGASYSDIRAAVREFQGDGEMCEFTGSPIVGKGLQCPCGCVVKAEVAHDPMTAYCPKCGRGLAETEDDS